MTELDKLIKELRDAPYHLDSLQCILVVQLILADRIRIVEPYLKTLKECKYFFEDPKLSTWPYVENGAMYSDIHVLNNKIKEILKGDQ